MFSFYKRNSSRIFQKISVLLIIFVLCQFQLSVFAQDTIAENAMVATAHPVASSVGVEVLKQGGNAVDAAMAIAFALSVAEPNASGIGGGGFMLIKMKDMKNAVMIDYREAAPGKATNDFFYHSNTEYDELMEQAANPAGVPGLVACADTALVRYGTMSLEEVLQPAIELCKQGIVVSEKLSAMIAENYEKIFNYPATAKIYLKDMLPLQTGDRLTNPDLANTLRMIAQEGGSVFYQGEIAEAIVKEVKIHQGLFDLSDMKKYQAKVRGPVWGTYRGYDIISSAPPSGGGTHLIELLNIMEGFDVKKMGHNSVEYIHVFAEALKMVYADKSLNAADPDFYDLPTDQLTTKSYADTLRMRIDMEKPRYDYEPKNMTQRESNSTSHVSIVDNEGNIIALTQSINHWFGCGIVVSGTGILLNDHLKDFDDDPGLPNSIEPYKRPTSSIAPTIVLKNGEPFLTLGTPGGSRIISALAQIIINVIDFDMSMDEAIEAPRVHCFKKLLCVEGRISDDKIQQLKSMGHPVKVYPDFDNYFGGAQGILIDSKSGKLVGGADSRRDGVAIGY